MLSNCLFYFSNQLSNKCPIFSNHKSKDFQFFLYKTEILKPEKLESVNIWHFWLKKKQTLATPLHGLLW